MEYEDDVYEDDVKALEAYRNVAPYTIDCLEVIIIKLQDTLYKSTDDVVNEVLKERIETIELNLSIIKDDNH